jgi:hypothetical protein
MINFEYDEKTYQEFLKNRKFPTNSRIRPDNVSFMDAILEGQRIMESTDEGKKALEIIGRLGE